MNQREVKADIAVVISVYEKTEPKKLQLSIQSLCAQTLKPQLILIVCDGCAISWISECISTIDFKGIPFEIIGYELNQGPGFARDFGIRRVNQRYIAIMDSDDISLSNRLKEQYDFMIKNPNVSVVGGIIEEFDAQTNISRFRKVPFTTDEIKHTLQKKSPVNNVTAFFNREDYLKSGGYPSLRSSEDYCLWGRFISNGMKIVNIDSIMVKVEFDDQALCRRRGTVHFKNDIFTQKELLKNGLISKPRYIKNIIKYFVFRNLPQGLKKMLYRYILRNK